MDAPHNTPIIMDCRALPIFLQHASSDQQVICTLLCLSRSIRDAVRLHCAGLVAITLRPQPGQQRAAACFPQWLTSNGTIVCSLDLSLGGMPSSTALLEALQAAQQPALPGLKCLQSNMLHPGMLQHLPASRLTRLDIGAPYASECWFSYAADSSAPLEAMRQLSQLQVLSLESDWADRLLPALPQLPQLRQLRLSQLACKSVAALQQLPQQLAELELCVAPSYRSFQRKVLQPQLQRLTALTALTSIGEGLFAVQAHDQPPAGLQRLMVADCPAAKPLTALTGLRLLAMTASTTPARELQLLAASLPRLTEVRLSYDRDAEVMHAAAPGWPHLPLKALELRVYPGPVTADTLAAMAACRGLERLTIAGYDVALDCSSSQLAAMLQQLTALREVKLAYLKMREPQPAAAAPAGSTEQAAEASGGGMAQLMRCIGRLPHLQSLTVARLPLGAAAAEVSAAAALTCLRLQECDLDDAVVAQILAAGLPRLQRLCLNCNIFITKEIVPVIAKCWPQQLTELSLWSTRVGSEGLRDSLPRLQVLVV